MTKPITAVAALIAQEKGLIDLNDKAVKYIPQLKGVRVLKADKDGNRTDMGEAKTDIRIYQLLAHTSGLGSTPFDMKMGDEHKQTLEKSIDFFIKRGLDFEPETETFYSAIAAFEIVVAIIEKVTGEDYLEFITREIFEPCEMVDTTFIPNDEQWGRLITMHDRVDGKSVEKKMPEKCIMGDYPCEHYVGGGGLVSTLSDYSKFALMLCNKGIYNGKRVISEESVKKMGTPHVPESIMCGRERWGLAVRVISTERYQVLDVGTFGWSGAYGSHFWVDPVNKVVAVYMKNSVCDGGAGNESARNFEKAVHESFIQE
ncbi:MAG: beta-lactamase family protein, partial [Clostridia bacterium]|nr:beta-lactamase family protein [Clostridia bacterium]